MGTARSPNNLGTEYRLQPILGGMTQTRRRASLLMLMPWWLSGQMTDEATWRKFLEWVPTVPPSDNPGNLLRQFQMHLVKSGASAAEAASSQAVVMKMMKVSPDGWQIIFNRIYASKTPGFSTRPNALLVSAVEGRAPGRSLDVGMGQGRNSVFLALRGWEATGFDVSDEGLAVARRNAEAAGVRINAVRKSNGEFDFGTAQWDLIVITYEPFPVTDSRYVARIAQALKPGGLVVIESFASDATAAVRKPVDIDPGELLPAFQNGFRILHFEDTMAVPDWDPGKTRLVRLVAEKRTR